MRAFVVTLGAAAVLLGAGSAGASAQSPAQSQLDSTLSQDMSQAGGDSGAYVVDLRTGKTLFSEAAGVGRLPASVEKVYTTSTALVRFGANGTLTTAIYGRGTLDSRGAWRGTLYVRGGGDPTFGSADFNASAYGTGATIQRLVSNLTRQTSIRSVRGRVVGDDSYFDNLRGTIERGYQFDPDVEGSLSALAFNRGLTDQGADYVFHPALYAAQQLVAALRAARVRVPGNIPIGAGRTPGSALELAAVSSPRISTLIALTNTPSDNFFAEMLIKGLGARFGGAGTTAAGAAVVLDELATKFGIHPSLDDGSGLSRDDSTSPWQVVRVLRGMAGNRHFVSSLAVAGETGTLQSRMQGTAAQDRCHGKTGTLHDVSNLVGYCAARDGHTLAFAFLMNSVDPSSARPIQDDMAAAVASYDG